MAAGEGRAGSLDRADCVLICAKWRALRAGQAISLEQAQAWWMKEIQALPGLRFRVAMAVFVKGAAASAVAAALNPGQEGRNQLSAADYRYLLAGPPAASTARTSSARVRTIEKKLLFRFSQPLLSQRFHYMKYN